MTVPDGGKPAQRLLAVPDHVKVVDAALDHSIEREARGLGRRIEMRHCAAWLDLTGQVGQRGATRRCDA